MNWIIILLVVAVVGFSLFQNLSGVDLSKSSSKPAADIPYRIKSPLFTPAESAFYRVLLKSVSDEQKVFGKVRVADVLQPTSGLSKSHWQTAFNRISAKHFDYVICEKSTLRVQAVVELHDKSHQKASRSNRDQFLRKACQSAGLTLLEFKVKSAYVTEEIRSALEPIQ